MSSADKQDGGVLEILTPRYLQRALNEDLSW